MNKLLEKKLIKLQTELKQERKEVRKVLMINRSGEEIAARKAPQILEECANERKMLRKYKMRSACELINYLVSLDFALRDLFLILREK